MGKQILLVLVAAGLGLALVSCGGGGAGVINLGATFPLTGPAALYGQWGKAGLDMAMAEINERGGINGKKINIIYEDCYANPQTCVSALKKLIDVDNVPLDFTIFSPPTLAQAGTAEQSKVVLLTSGANANAISKAGDFVFRHFSISDKEGALLADYVLQKTNYRRAAAIVLNNDGTLDIKDGFKKVFEQGGGEVTSVQPYGLGTTDFKTHLLKMKATNPELYLVFPQAGEAPLIIQQIRELGIKEPIYGSQGIESNELLNIVGKSADGIVHVALDFNTDDASKVTRDFVARYKHAHGEEPSFMTLLAYDSMYIVAEALKNCEQLTGTCVKDNLYKIDGLQGVTGIKKVDQAGDVEVKPVLKTIKDGRFVRL